MSAVVHVLPRTVAALLSRVPDTDLHLRVGDHTALTVLDSAYGAAFRERQPALTAHIRLKAAQFGGLYSAHAAALSSAVLMTTAHSGCWTHALVRVVLLYAALPAPDTHT